MTILKENTPLAQKNHTCMYCGCTIPAGEKYSRTTIVCDGELYDWVAHKDCCDIADKLGMFDELNHDEGLTPQGFEEYIDEYLVEKYHDGAQNNIPEHIRRMRRIEQVRMILKEIQASKNKTYGQARNS